MAPFEEYGHFTYMPELYVVTNLAGFEKRCCSPEAGHERLLNLGLSCTDVPPVEMSARLEDSCEGRLIVGGLPPEDYPSTVQVLLLVPGTETTAAPFGAYRSHVA